MTNEELIQKLSNRSPYRLENIWWRLTMPLRRWWDIKKATEEIDALHKSINFLRRPSHLEWLEIAQEIDWICDSIYLEWNVQLQGGKVNHIYEFLRVHKYEEPFTLQQVLKTCPKGKSIGFVE
jgi:hypothetical protein